MTDLLNMTLVFFEYFIGIALMADIPGYAIHWQDNPAGHNFHWEVIPEEEMERRIASGEISESEVIGLRDDPVEENPTRT